MQSQNAAVDDPWTKHKKEGGKLMKAMNLSYKSTIPSDEQRGSFESKFQNYGDLQSNGWNHYEGPQIAGNNAYDLYGLGCVLKDLKISHPAYMDKLNVAVKFRHDIPNPNGPWPTKAEYVLAFHPQKGLICTFTFTCPEDELKKLPQESRSAYKLPTLNNWSDVAFLGWKHASAALPVGVEAPLTIIHANIAREETLDAIFHVVNVTTKEVPDWSKRVELWPIRNESGMKILLGTPEGSAVAMFLITHKASFEAKVIQYISVFSTESKGSKTRQIHLLFRIGNAKPSSTSKIENPGKSVTIGS